MRSCLTIWVLFRVGFGDFAWVAVFCGVWVQVLGLVCMQNCDLRLDFGLCCLVLCFGLGFGVGL